MIKLKIGMINSITFEVIQGHEMASLINRASFLVIDHSLTDLNKFMFIDRSVSSIQFRKPVNRRDPRAYGTKLP